MTREELITKLRRKYQAPTDDKLMDALQDLGLVSDNAVTISDCADRDLIAALE